MIPLLCPSSFVLFIFLMSLPYLIIYLFIYLFSLGQILIFALTEMTRDRTKKEDTFSS